MQRKGRKYKDKLIGLFSLTYHTNISNKLHSIPKLKKNVKSNVLYSIPSIAVVALLFGLFASIHLGWFAGSSNSVYAAEETIGDSTASMTLDTSDVEVAVTPGGIGYVSKDITINATNTESYTLSISSTGINGPTTITNAGTNSTIAEMPNNSWGYAYGDSVNVEEATYSTISSDATTLESGTSTNNTKKTLAFAAKFSDDAIPGRYNAEVTLSLVATPRATTYTLTFNANGGSGGTTSKTCTTYGTSCTISLSDVTTPTRTSYTFLGWADSNNATSAQYTASSTITMNGNKTIYAVWELTVTGFGDIRKMQDMTSSICNSVSNSTTGQLYDTRDNSTYTVQKMADGKCWMTQNLHLRLSTSTTLTPADTNVSSNWTPTNDTLSSLSSSNFSSSSGYYKVESYIATPDNNTIAGLTGYYSFTAATASWDKTGGKTSGSSPQSICPKGWKLPTGGSNGDFQALYSAGGITGGNNKPWYYTGIASARTALANTTSSGYWWTSTIYDNMRAYYVVVNSGISPTGYNIRSDGMAVRCIAAN